MTVDLGGSAVNNLADNLQLFGLAPGSTNLFAATYTVFGNIVKSQYPELVPSFDPVPQILDASLVKELAAGGDDERAPTSPQFDPAKRRSSRSCSRTLWDIQFATGSAKFSRRRGDQLKKMFNDLVVASGTIVEIHGHTDNQGTADANKQLREDRAFAVKTWLEAQSPSNFPDGRIKVFAHGQTEPLDVELDGRGQGEESPRRDRARHQQTTKSVVKLAREHRSCPTAPSIARRWLALVALWVGGRSRRLAGLAVRELPRPGEVWHGASATLWWKRGMAPELFTTLKLISHALLLTIAISMALSYADGDRRSSGRSWRPSPSCGSSASPAWSFRSRCSPAAATRSRSSC